MAKLFNLAKMSTATTGTGTITLGSAATGFLTFAQAGVSDGDVVYYGISDGTNAEVGYGTYTSSGTTLTRTVQTSTNSNSAINLSGSAFVFIQAPKNAFVFQLLSTLTASSSASLDDTTSLTSEYDVYMIAVRNMTPATNAVNAKFRVKVAGTFQTTGYVNSGSTTTDGVDLTIAAGAPTAVSNDATSGGVSGVFFIQNPSGTTTYKQITGTGGAFSGAGTYPASTSGRLNASAGAYVTGSGAVTGVQFLFSSGNIASGVMQVYGIRTAQ